MPACLYILNAETHHTVSEFDQLSCRDAKSHATLLEQAQALDAAQAYMLGVSEQVSLAELATELAEARAAFMEQHPGNALYAMTGLECKRVWLCVSLVCKATLPLTALLHMQIFSHNFLFYQCDGCILRGVSFCGQAASLQLQLHLHVILQTFPEPRMQLLHMAIEQ